MLRAAGEWTFRPGCVIIDSLYSSIENLKLIRFLKWHWCTRLKSNRLVDPDNTGNRSVSDSDILPEGLVVHLRQYGFFRVFRIVHPDKDPESAGMSQSATSLLLLIQLSNRFIAGECSSDFSNFLLQLHKSQYNQIKKYILHHRKKEPIRRIHKNVL